MLPRWPGLDNLEKVISVTFADGKTHLSILKVRSCWLTACDYSLNQLNLLRQQHILPCVHYMLKAGDEILFRAIRLIATLRMYAGFHVMTKTRIKRGRQMIREFGDLIPVSLTLVYLDS